MSAPLPELPGQTVLERLTWLESTCPERSPTERLPLLQAAALDAAREVRRFAAAGLPAARPLSTARRALAALLRDEDKKVRHLSAIGLLEVATVLDEGEGAHGSGVQAPVVPDAAEPSDLPPLPYLVDGATRALKDPALAHAATRALGLCGHASARAPLQRLARRWLGDPWVRLEAAASLARLGVPDHVPTLRRALKGRRMLRPMAAALLGELKVMEARPELEAMLLDAREPHAYAAADALAELGDLAASPTLKRAAESHPDEETRKAAAAALKRLLNPEEP